MVDEDENLQGQAFEQSTDPVEPGGGKDGHDAQQAIANTDAGDKVEKLEQAKHAANTQAMSWDESVGKQETRPLPDHLHAGTGDGISWPKEHRGISGLRTLGARPQLMHPPITPDAKPRTAAPREAIPQTPWGAASDPTRKKEEKVVKPGETAG